MKKYGVIIILAVYFLGLASFVNCEVSYSDSVPNHNVHQNSLLAELDESRNAAVDASNDNSNNYDKRMERYAFGLGRRAYTYPNGNGVKRLPVYNFGLGKRARPYAFGLGKRSDDYDNQYDTDFDRYLDDKRNRPYSFGLGKRGLDERQVNRYGFGLGR